MVTIGKTAYVYGNNESSSYYASVTIPSLYREANTVVNYGNVSQPTITQHTCFPASGVETLSNSNLSNYFSISGSSQTLTWASGSTSSGTIS